MIQGFQTNRKKNNESMNHFFLMEVKAAAISEDIF